MKKVNLTRVFLSLIIASLACQTISNFSGGDLTNTPKDIATVEPTELVIPATAPADVWIAFVYKNNVWLVHPDGTDHKQVTSNPIPEGEAVFSEDIKLKWSQNGQNLAFTQSGSLYVFDVSTFT